LKGRLIEPFTVKDLKVDGHDVMEILKIKPSRQVGEILDQFRELGVETVALSRFSPAAAPARAR
jgi:hypothetical protein